MRACCMGVPAAAVRCALCAAAVVVRRGEASRFAERITMVPAVIWVTCDQAINRYYKSCARACSIWPAGVNGRPKVAQGWRSIA